MKKSVLSLFLALSSFTALQAQTKPTIAVANPSVNGLYATPVISAKLIRLELIKLDQYTVYDEFDMAEIYKSNPEFATNCISKNCLQQLGEKLNVDYTISGSFDALGNKIVISLKLVDVKSGTLYKTIVKEYDNQEAELQRMTEIAIKEMHGVSNEKELVERLQFKNEVITSNNVGKINNSGPRIGYAFMTGSLAEFATRGTDRGGLDIFPAVSMIGYQFEGQYVGTENFSALIEGIININGLEQGQFIPSISVMNGFRFGKAGWEFAFGPGFGLKKTTYGFFDNHGLLGDAGKYWNENDWNSYVNRELYDDPQYNTQGYFIPPSVSDIHEDYDFSKKYADTRGSTSISTMFVVAFGRTFRAGALNIPVNVFYSSRKGGGMAGMSVGFNVMKSKKPINDVSDLR
jgi:hypothetical protein